MDITTRSGIPPLATPISLTRPSSDALRAGGTGATGEGWAEAPGVWFAVLQGEILCCC